MKDWVVKKDVANITKEGKNKSPVDITKKDVISVSEEKIKKGGKSMDEDVRRELEKVNKSIEEQRKFNEKIGSVIDNFFAKEKEKQENARIQSQIEPIITPLREEVKRQGETLQSLQKKLEPFGEVCTSVEECKAKLAKYEKKAEEIPPKETGEVSPETPSEEMIPISAHDRMFDILKSCPECWNGWTDKEGNQHRGIKRQILEAMSEEDLQKALQDKEITKKFTTAVCTDEACRVGLSKAIKEYEKKQTKKLL